jgi:large subunit ribosomal protein LP2
MKYIAAYVLLVLGGNSSPKQEDVTDVLAAVGVQADAQQLSLLIKDLQGKDIYDLLASGSKAIDDIYCRTIVSAPAPNTPRIRKSVFWLCSSG